MDFNKHYFWAFIVLLSIEIFIAIFVRDAFIRPYFGDYLATIGVYTFLKSFTRFSFLKALIISLLFSFLIEIIQAFNVLNLTNLDKSSWVSIGLGTSFDWGDILAYTLGAFTVFLFENKINNHKFN